MAKRLHVGHSKIIPRILQIMADEEDMRILLALPADVPALSDQLGLSNEELERRLHELFLKGIVFVSKKSTPPSYRTAREIIHLHDTSVQWKKAPKEFLDLWQKWMEEEFIGITKQIDKVLAGQKPLTRIIAANVWLEPPAKSEVMHYDSIKEIVQKAKSLAVLPCTCRLKAKKCDHLLEACIVLNKSADYINPANRHMNFVTRHRRPCDA